MKLIINLTKKFFLLNILLFFYIFFTTEFFSFTADCMAPVDIIIKKIEAMKHVQIMKHPSLMNLHGKFALADTKELYNGNFYIFSRQKFGPYPLFLLDQTLVGQNTSQFINCQPCINFSSDKFIITLVENHTLPGLNEEMTNRLLDFYRLPKTHLVFLM